MNTRKTNILLLITLIIMTTCGKACTSPGITSTASATTSADSRTRNYLTYSDLTTGFDSQGIINEDALSMPDDALPSPHSFQGRLELLNESRNGEAEVLGGSLSNAYKHLPEFNMAFIQMNEYLIPIQRGLIVTEQSTYDLILEPGHIWMEEGDQGFSRASLPFVLVFKGDNALLNGTLTFLFDGEIVSKVWYQITQETTQNTQANLWGLLDAAYHAEPIPEIDQVRDAFEQELAQRFPTQPIENLAEVYPGVDLSAFGSGVTPEHLAWYGVIVDGINYLGGCQTRAGVYPYCEWMRQPSYSVAKSTFPALALMRLAQVYGPNVADLLIKDYVPESADSIGDWETVTFNNALDMATENSVPMNSWRMTIAPRCSNSLAATVSQSVSSKLSTGQTKLNPERLGSTAPAILSS